MGTAPQSSYIGHEVAAILTEPGFQLSSQEEATCSRNASATSRRHRLRAAGGAPVAEGTGEAGTPGNPCPPPQLSDILFLRILLLNSFMLLNFNENLQNSRIQKIVSSYHLYIFSMNLSKNAKKEFTFKICIYFHV